MRRARHRWAWLVGACALLTTLPARADEPPPTTTEEEPAQLPYTVPRQTLVPGTPGMAGGIHLMVNAFAHAQNVGLGGHRIENANVRGWSAGATLPLLTDDWAMAYG